MGTAILVFLVLCVVFYWIGRSAKTKQQNTSIPPKQRSAISSNRPFPQEKTAPSLQNGADVRQVHIDGVRRNIMRNELRPDQRQALTDIRRQNALDRQHDSRMAAAAGLAGVVAGAALMHHHDAQETQAHIDQVAAMQRDALAMQDQNDSDVDDPSTDDFDIDQNVDWSADDDGQSDSDDYDNDDYDSDDYNSDDYDYDDASDTDDYDADDYPDHNDGFDYSDDAGSYDDYGDYGGDDGGDFF